MNSNVVGVMSNALSKDAHKSGYKYQEQKLTGMGNVWANVKHYTLNLRKEYTGTGLQSEQIIVKGSNILVVLVVFLFYN